MSGNKQELAEVAQKHGITLIVLFGSRARGYETAYSDTDLAVWLEKTGHPTIVRLCPESQRRLFADLATVFHTGNLDLIILNHATPLMQFQIAKTGKPLYEATPHLFAQFQVRATKLHHDAMPFYRLEKIYLDKKYGGGMIGRPLTDTTQTGQAAPVPGGIERAKPL